jgi:hypothetical protein
MTATMKWLADDEVSEEAKEILAPPPSPSP